MPSIFLSKVLVNETLQVPNRAPMDRAVRIEGFCNVPLKFLIKIPLNKEFFPFSQKTPGKERPSMFPKSGAPTGTDVNFQSLT
jgi:hypothetical protein